jgi:prefoldin subunit 5
MDKLLEVLDKKIDKVEEKLDDVNASIKNIDVTLVRQHASLEEHIRRTELLEDKMEHVDRHVTMVRGVGKFIVWDRSSIGYCCNYCAAFTSQVVFIQR